MLKVRPHTKSGGGGQSTSGPIYEKWGGGGGGQSTSGVVWRSHTLAYTRGCGYARLHQVRYTKRGGGGGGGGGQFASGPIRKVGGGGGQSLQVRYLCLAHRKYFIVNYKRLQF